MSKPRKKARKTAPAAKAEPGDAALVRACVAYAQAMAAFEAGFTADPDGNSSSAEKLGERHSRKAAEALDVIAGTSAQTPCGIEAKARIFPTVFRDYMPGGVGEPADSFVEGFIDDVRKLLTQLAQQEAQP